MFLAAAVQMRSGNDRAANEARALELLGEAAGRGALLIGLPEMWEHIGPAREKHAFAGPVEGAQLARVREFCAKRAVWCLAGSIAELQEARIVPLTIIEGAPRLPVFGIYPTVESLVMQGALLALAIVAAAWALRPNPSRGGAEGPDLLRAK